jgi:ABC-type transporter Mla subunit MlaD
MASPLDLLTAPLRAPLRAVLGGAERAESDVVDHTPLREAQELETKLGEAVAAVHRAADSIERHIAVLEGLADSLPPLTASVTRLTDQLGDLLRLTAPLQEAEQDVSRIEGEVSRIERLLGRRRHVDNGPAPPA